MNPIETVNDLSPGEYGIIKQINAADHIKQRFMDLGLIEGTEVEMIRSAPLGDPIEIKVLDTLLALRRREASKLIIDYRGVKYRGHKFRHRHRSGRKSKQR